MEEDIEIIERYSAFTNAYYVYANREQIGTIIGVGNIPVYIYFN